MQKNFRWIHVALEVIGALTVAAGLGLLLLWLFFINPMSHFAGGNCADTDEHVIASPDGKSTVKFNHTLCYPYTFESVYLSTGNPNPGYEYAQIVELKNVAIGETSVTWKGPQEVAIEFPATAEVLEAYAKIFGVQVTLHPH